MGRVVFCEDIKRFKGGENLKGEYGIFLGYGKFFFVEKGLVEGFLNFFGYIDLDIWNMESCSLERDVKIDIYDY